MGDGALSSGRVNSDEPGKIGFGVKTTSPAI
jgi:hypothetical protein